MYNDKITLSVAEAVKQVTSKKESAKDYTNRGGTGHDDFVDLHSIDKQKRRGSEPLTEKDIEEANEFTKAAAKAAIAGDKEFTFDGKTYPSEMDVDVAKKILGKNESTDLEEAKGFPESSQGAKMTYDRVVKLSASLKKGSNLNKAVNKRLGGKYDSDFAKMEKAIATIFNTLDEIDREYVMSDFDESANLEEAKEIKLAGKPSTKITTNGKKTIISVAGGENVTVNLPVDKVVSIGKSVGIWDGKKVNKAIEGPDAWEDFDDEVEKAGGEITLAESIELDEAIDFLLECENINIQEMSDEELDEMLEGILGTIGSGIKRAAGRLSTSGRAAAATKKADKLDKKAADREKLKKAKERIQNAKDKARRTKNAEKLKAKKAAERKSAAKARLAKRNAKRNESADLEEASNADLKKVLATAKNIGGVVKGNTADFGQGAVIDFSIEKGKIKFDGGKSSGVEYFNNVKDAISALMIGFDE